MANRLMNKMIIPSYEEMISYCKELGNLFVFTNNLLNNKHDMMSKICFPYGNNYGWCISYHQKNKLVCNIFPEDHAFTIMIRLTNKQFDKLYNEISTNLQKVIDNKYPCNDAGWIHYEIVSEDQKEDIIKLLALK